MARLIVSRIAVITALAAAIGASAANAQSSTGQITVLYDAFGKTSTMTKDWGFAALVEYGGKRILFDTGNNAEIFAHNIEAKGVDLEQLDFVIVSHRHGDHTSGLNHLLKVNPAVKIYAPQENFGVFGAVLPGTFYRRNESLPEDMRYFDGKPPETLRFGTPWPEGNFTWITKTTEVASGFYLILLSGTWGVDFCTQHAVAAERWPCATRCRNFRLWLRHSGHALGRRLPCRASRLRAAAFPAEFSGDLGRAPQ